MASKCKKSKIWPYRPWKMTFRAIQPNLSFDMWFMSPQRSSMPKKKKSYWSVSEIDPSPPQSWRTDGQTDRRTDGQTDGQTDRRTTDKSVLEKLRCLSAGGAKKSKFWPLTFKKQPFEWFNQILLMICCLCHPKEASCKKIKKVIEQFLRKWSNKPKMSNFDLWPSRNNPSSDSTKSYLWYVVYIIPKKLHAKKEQKLLNSFWENGLTNQTSGLSAWQLRCLIVYATPMMSNCLWYTAKLIPNDLDLTFQCHPRSNVMG